MEPQFFKTYGDFKEWFVRNHGTKQELWVGFYKKSTKKESITWEESVEVALIFGWIDGIRKSIDEESYKIRFTPRRPGSNWSLKNIKTAEQLIEKKLMHPAGLKVFRKRKPEKSGVYSFERVRAEFNKEFETLFRKNETAWSFFTSQAPYYRKAVINWVMSAKQEKTRRKRLNELMSDSENLRKIKAMRRNSK